VNAPTAGPTRRRLVPTGELAEWVAHLWVHDRPAPPHRRERLPPSASAELVIPISQPALWRYLSPDDTDPTEMPGGVMQGPSDRPWLAAVEGALHVAGVRFRPGGLVALFGPEALAATRRCLPLATWRRAALAGWREALGALPDDAARLHWLQRQLQAQWAQQRAQAGAPDDRLREAIRAFEAGASRVAPVQQASGLSPARFSTRFSALVGLPPRTVLRLLRVAEAPLPVAEEPAPSADLGPMAAADRPDQTG
jgi:hypothetical protein